MTMIAALHLRPGDRLVGERDVPIIAVTARSSSRTGLYRGSDYRVIEFRDRVNGLVPHLPHPEDALAHGWPDLHPNYVCLPNDHLLNVIPHPRRRP